MGWKGVVGGGVIALGALCAGLGWAARDTVGAVVDVGAAIFEEPEWAELDDEERVLAYLVAHPEEVSLAWASVGADGSAIEGSGGRHRADVPRVMASTMKIVVLGAWARAVEEGAIDADAPVRLGEWDGWYLHGLDGGAHGSAYDRMGVSHTDGVASDPERTVPMHAVVQAMIEESDNAATDLLIARLGEGVGREARAVGHDPIPPLFGDMVEMMRGDPCVQRAPVDVSDGGVRAGIVAGGLPVVGLRDQRARVHCVLPRGTADAYVTLLGGVVSGTHGSQSVSQRMSDVLDWPMERGGNAERFEVFGSKGGCVPGVLTEASYLVPKQGDFAGERRVVVLQMNGMSGSAWLAGMGSFAHQRFMVRLATDRAFADRVRDALVGL